MVEESGWAALVAAAVNATFASAGASKEADLHSVTAASQDQVEVVWSAPWASGLLGLRIDLASVQVAGWRIRDSSPDELAFDIVHVGVCEPKSMDHFYSPDESGIRWLRLAEWLDEIS